MMEKESAKKTMPYKLNSLKSCWIFFVSFFIMVYFIFTALIVPPFLKPEKKRARVDKWLDNWSRLLINQVKSNVKVTYTTPIKWEPGTNYILLSNHLSLYDIPLIYRALPPSIRMLAKKELKSIPFFGNAMTQAEFIFIDRKNRTQAILDLEKAKAKLTDGIKLWIAPEGTRSRTGNLLPFKKGPFMLAIQTNAVIIPIGIVNSNKIMSPNSLNINLHQDIEIRIGEPIDARNYSQDQKEQLMEEVRNIIADLAKEKLETEKDDKHA
jgi:1-acyl-sn-glycerol-3-phosphate acyltransferase